MVRESCPCCQEIVFEVNSWQSCPRQAGFLAKNARCIVNCPRLTVVHGETVSTVSRVYCIPSGAQSHIEPPLVCCVEAKLLSATF